MRLPRLVLITLLLATSTGPAIATVITVNGNGKAEYTTIQAAIDAAADSGDEIIVEAGIYTGTGDSVIDLQGKTFLLRSSAGPEETIIDGENTRAGIVCINPPGGSQCRANIEGFTIRNGLGINRNQAAGGSSRSGGAIELSYASPTITNCVFWNNRADRGGGLYCESGNPTLENCTFEENTAVAFFGGGMALFNSSATARGCLFRNNTGPRGGGIYAEGGRPMLIDCTIEANRAEVGSGGGFRCLSATPRLSACTFSGNSTPRFGGGLYSNNSNLIGNDCIFTGNNANWGAGWAEHNSSAVLTGCEFRNNTANFNGGGYFNDRNPARGLNGPTMEDCTFEGNQAGWNGGGILAFFASVNLTACTFSGNSAGQTGGGVSNFNAPANCNECVFTGNNASLGGGWYDIDSSQGNGPQNNSRFTGCEFRENVARSRGGGLYCLSETGNSKPILGNCSFSNNSAVTSGGGLEAADSEPVLSDCTFTGNSSQFGGGVTSMRSSSLSVNCRFTQNTATRGGAWLNFDSTTTLRDCEFHENTATETDRDPAPGGAVDSWRQDSVSNISGSTFCGNQPLAISPPGSWKDSGENLFSDTCEEDLPGETPPFLRGDSNGDAVLDVSDAITTLGFLFLGDNSPACRAAADSNADGNFDISDAIFILNFLFLGGEAFSPPTECSVSEQRSDIVLGCENSSCQ